MEKVNSGQLTEEKVFSNIPIKKKIEIKKGEIVKSTLTKSYEDV